MTIILSVKLPDTYYDTIFYFALSKCYVNSVMATLNTRDHVKIPNNDSTTLKLSVLRNGQTLNNSVSGPSLAKPKSLSNDDGQSGSLGSYPDKAMEQC
ncbi:hypothetical protein HGRIS_003498 [Hohenbuehelia grisea]|uniref:DUF6534 domain-containing protein n=1 Tax=Hohenbuehelia grisea TaxID=104357 RepID=A0ABR3JFN4_9AGAR